MLNGQPAKLLRLHLSEHDQRDGKPIYQTIVQKCRELGIAGATVFRGVEGFGESAEIHRPHLLTHHLPIVVTVVDTEDNIKRLIPVVEEIIDTGLIAMSDVEVVRIQKKARQPNV